MLCRKLLNKIHIIYISFQNIHECFCTVSWNSLLHWLAFWLSSAGKTISNHLILCIWFNSNLLIILSSMIENDVPSLSISEIVSGTTTEIQLSSPALIIILSINLFKISALSIGSELLIDSLRQFVQICVRCITLLVYC